MMNIINTKIKLNDLSYLQFTREYTKEKEERINRILGSGKIYTVEEITKILKTVYENNPLSLTISYTNDNDLYIISYEDNEFKYKHKKRLYQGEKIEVTYEDEKLNFTSTTIDQVSFFIKEETKRIRRLKNMKGYSLNSLTKEERNLWKYYKFYYQENPDFSKEEIKRKAKDMISILEHYNTVATKADYEREKAFENLAPFGEIKEDLEERIDASSKKIRMLGEIGKRVNEYLREDSPITPKEQEEKSIIYVKAK